MNTPAKGSVLPDIQFTDSVLMGCRANKNAAIRGRRDLFLSGGGRICRVRKYTRTALRRWRRIFSRCIKPGERPRKYLSIRKLNPINGR
jgi:hypothetical protein